MFIERWCHKRRPRPHLEFVRKSANQNHVHKSVPYCVELHRCIQRYHEFRLLFSPYCCDQTMWHPRSSSVQGTNSLQVEANPSAARRVDEKPCSGLDFHGVPSTFGVLVPDLATNPRPYEETAVVLIQDDGTTICDAHDRSSVLALSFYSVSSHNSKKKQFQEPS